MGGLWTDIGYVNIVDPGQGVGVQTLGMLIFAEFGDRYGNTSYYGVGVFGKKLGMLIL